MYLTVDEVNGLIEEKNGNKYLVFDSTDDENKKVLTKYTDFWNVIKNEIEKVNGGKKGEYKQDFMEIKFSSDDNLPLNKILKFHMLAIVVRSVIDKDGKIYLSIGLDKCLYEIQKWFSMKELTILKKLILIKLINEKSVKSVMTTISTMVLNLIQKFVIVVTGE